MRLLLLLVLALGWIELHAQETSEQHVFRDLQAGYRLKYPRGWQLERKPDTNTASFYAGGAGRAAEVLASAQVAVVNQYNEAADSVWLAIRRQPQAQVLRLTEQASAAQLEVRYDYTYLEAPAPALRTHVVGRRVWRNGYEYRLEYHAAISEDHDYLPQAQQLLESLSFVAPAPPTLPVVKPVVVRQRCDDKMYGIAALRTRNGIWEDDCRTIHEFSVANPSAQPTIHRSVLPFQSYALAKGLDNCLYSVTKAPTDAPEYVYRYNPATREGAYTPWRLPAQGEENVWISAATDARGDLYFITSDGNKLVKVSPADSSVKVVWSTDPVRRAAYYTAIGFSGAGTHANFCLADNDTVYQVYSTDGSLLKIDLGSQQPAPELVRIDGLPKRGGYSDVLMQEGPGGGRELYLAGPKALYRVDLEKRQAQLVRRGVYTDLAGCNLFDVAPPTQVPPAAVAPAVPTPAAAAPPRAASWRGRILDAVTLQPLPQTRYKLRNSVGEEILVPLGADGSFAVEVEAGRSYVGQAQLGGYGVASTFYSANSGSIAEDILLQPLAVGVTLPLDNVQFQQGKAVLLPSSHAALDQLVGILTANPGIAIELQGHTDNVGDPQKNVVLSQMRAAAVKTYLVHHGIASGRIASVGFGGARPRASNAREATRRLNRRVEFRITSVQP
ncbi:OmpA family protein [Hymenobacter latericus]|uniref:OmpA family protein n=1 Tax=Hymenobacter sp. YIM 151858-1 TaxID=2987688 RepID=UPI002226A562|nr:OmpA family protein [Hymenobacter sp. YIM 151858-1]UYZ59943.1 OmpA family protein [Hymenobacter sp. YIM 151858-1]